MKLHCGIDLHTDNGYYGIVSEDGKRVFGKRIKNEPEKILATLGRYQADLSPIAIESSCSWYWLADLLEDNGYHVVLANPAAIQQYHGLKDGNDESDAFFLAELDRLGILPTGYIIPRQYRPVRDLLRRRLLLVQNRTSLILSVLSLLNRETGKRYSWAQAEKLLPAEIEALLPDDRILAFTALQQILSIHQLTETIEQFEDTAEQQVERLWPEFGKLRTIPGIGKILGMTIMLETVDIRRFPHCGDYTSYCRCTSARRTSNDKKKGSNNRKNGNRYLSWAYVEAAHHCRIWCSEARNFYQRKRRQANVALATKALAAKLTKAAYHILRDQVDFDVKKCFG